MEPFRITCTTCKARLKVREPELIGQILACPRCQSMVEIVAPAAASPAAEPNATTASSNSPQPSASLTDSTDASFDAIPDMLAGVPVPASSIDTPAAPSDSTSDPKKQTKQSSSKKQKAAAAAAVAVAAAASPDVASAASLAESTIADSAMPSGDWASPTELLWKKIALWGTAGGAGLFLVGGLVGVWIAKSGDQEGAGAESVQTAGLDDGAGNSTKDPDISNPTEDSELPEAQEDSPKEDSANAPLATKDEDSNSKPLDSTAKDSDVEGGQREPAPKSGEAAQAATDLKQPPNLPPIAEDTPAPAPNKGLDLNNPDEEAEAPEAAHPAAVRYDPAATDEWVPGEVAKRLEVRLPRVSFQSVAMIDVINFVSQTANVPITIDIDVLEIYGISPNASVSIDKENVKLSEVLRSALRPFKLSYLEQDGQVRVVSPNLKGGNIRLAKQPIDDLTGSSTANAAHLVATIKRLVAPSRWDTASGPGTLEAVADSMWVNQTVPVRYEVLAFCERLRLARKLPPKSRLAAERFSLVSDRTLAKKSLDRPVTFTFHSPTQFNRVTRFLEQSTGQTILINWESLIASGFTPATKVTCGVVDQPLGESLTSVLTPIGLGWRSLDAQTIEVMSLADSRTARELVFHNASPWIGRGYNEAQLQTLASKVTNQLDPRLASKVEVVLDAPSHRLIVLGNQASQEQIGKALAAMKD